jgi:hypothetical protein
VGSQSGQSLGCCATAQDPPALGRHDRQAPTRMRSDCVGPAARCGVNPSAATSAGSTCRCRSRCTTRHRPGLCSRSRGGAAPLAFCAPRWKHVLLTARSTVGGSARIREQVRVAGAGIGTSSQPNSSGCPSMPRSSGKSCAVRSGGARTGIRWSLPGPGRRARRSAAAGGPRSQQRPPEVLLGNWPVIRASSFGSPTRRGASLRNMAFVQHGIARLLRHVSHAQRAPAVHDRGAGVSSPPGAGRLVPAWTPVICATVIAPIRRSWTPTGWTPTEAYAEETGGLLRRAVTDGQPQRRGRHRRPVRH